jgi:hypothetical protein
VLGWAKLHESYFVQSGSLKAIGKSRLTFPEPKVRYITGLTDKADIDDWLGGSRKIAWLRSQGYAK